MFEPTSNRPEVAEDCKVWRVTFLLEEGAPEALLESYAHAANPLIAFADVVEKLPAGEWWSKITEVHIELTEEET